MQIFHQTHGDYMAHHSIDATPIEADFPLHAHPHCEVFYFIKGEGYYTVEGRDYPLVPGNILLLRDGEIHKLHISPDHPYERMAIHFPLDSVLEQGTPFATLRALFLERSPGCSNLFVPQSNDSAAFLQSCFSRICRPCRDKDEFDLRLKAHLPPLLTELYNLRAEQNGATAAGRREDNSAVPEIIDYINRHLTEIEGLAELERRFFISKSTLNRLFSESTGSTVWEYVIIKRLHAARRLLLDGKSAALAAAACGFGDYSAFYRQYRRIFGESPRREQQTAKNFEKP
jgi:AraC-like DNA-binding protein